MFLGTRTQSPTILNYLNRQQTMAWFWSIPLLQTIPWHALGAHTGQLPFLVGNVNVATLSLMVKEFKNT